MKPALLFLITFALHPLAPATQAQEPSGGPGNTATAAFPASAGGELARLFVAAINDADEQAVQRFVSEHVPVATSSKLTPDKWRDMMAKLRLQSGGLELKRVLGQSESSATVLLESRKGAHILGLEIRADKTNANRVAGIELHPLPPLSGPKPTSLPKEKVAPSQVAELIAQHVTETVALDRFSGVVLVAKDDAILLHRACGFANKDLKLTNRVDTRFGSASVGKMFTGVAIAQLVEAGKLRFEDTIGSVLTDYPNREAAARVTVEHLLTHTSGVADPFESPQFKSGFKATRQADWFPLFAAEPIKAEPGKRHRYSNGGYVVLAAMVEKLSGKPFAQYVCDHIFRPAKMTSTGCVARKNADMSLAAPHQRPMLDDPLGIEPRRVKAIEFKHDAAGMGGWQTTTEDLFRFARALRTNALLSAASTAEVVRGRASVAGERVRYAYGFYDIEAKGDRMIGHSGGGGDLAVAADVEMLWNSGYTVVILSNYDLEETRRLGMDISRFLRAQASP